MKAWIVALSMVMAMMVTTAWAGELQWATGLELKDSFGLARNFNTGDNPDARGGAFGIYSGSLIGYYSSVKKEAGNVVPAYKLFGFGGVTMYASSSLDGGGVKWMATITPITIFNDTFHLDIGRNFNDDATVVVLGISGTEVVNLLTKAAGAVTP